MVFQVFQNSGVGMNRLEESLASLLKFEYRICLIDSIF